MKTQNLSTLKIHKLTQAQYERELAAGRIDEDALYLTPDESIDTYSKSEIDNKLENIGFKVDWNILDENNPAYIKNKPFDYEIEYTLINSNELTIGSDSLSEEDWVLTGGHGIALMENEYYMITFNDKTYIEKCIKYREAGINSNLDLHIGDKIKTPFEIINNDAYGFAIFFSKEYDKNSFIEIKKLKIKDTPSHFIKDMYYSEKGDYYQGKVDSFFLVSELNKSTSTIYFDKDIFKDVSNLSYVKVEWDGVEYTSMVFIENDSSDFKKYFIGNINLWENSGTTGEILQSFNFSEPFAMGYGYYEGNNTNIRGFNSSLSILTTDTEATEHTIRIFDDEHQDTVHQIDKKYIPFNGADWEEVNPSKLSYIKNKPFGKTNEEIIVEYQQWPNTDGEGTNYWGEEVTLTMADMLNLFEIGEKYEVTIEGKTYITECKYFVDNELGTKYNFIGNEKILAIANGSEESINKAIDTGENFAFSHVPENGSLFGVVKGFEPKEGVTYGIKKININYLPHYYIKDMYYSEINENIFIQEQFIHGFQNAADLGFNGYAVTMVNAYPGEKPLVPNQTYKIVWDGVEYECLAISGAPDDADYVEIYMGNLSPMGGEDTGEPFIIVYGEESGMNQFVIGTPSTEERHKLKIYQGDSVETIHQIPSKYVDAYTKPEIDSKLENIGFENDYKLIFNIIEGNNSYTYLSINENGEETIYDLHFALGRWGDVAVDSSNNAFSKRDYYFQWKESRSPYFSIKEKLMSDNCNYEFILLDEESGTFGKSKNFNIMNTGNYLGIYIDFGTSRVRLSDQLYGDGPAEPD